MESLADESYSQFLADLKGRIRAAQLRAALAVNRELVLLYWQIGRDILDRQARESWGAFDLVTGDVARLSGKLAESSSQFLVRALGRATHA